MKIKDLRIHSIAIADPPLRSSYGLHAPYALRTIIELESEDGVVGINETYGGESPAAALRAVRSRIIGANAFRITGTINPAMEKFQSNGQDRSQTHGFYKYDVEQRIAQRGLVLHIRSAYLDHDDAVTEPADVW